MQPDSPNIQIGIWVLLLMLIMLRLTQTARYSGAVASLQYRDDLQPRASWFPLSLRVLLTRNPSRCSHGAFFSFFRCLNSPSSPFKVYIVSFSLGFGPIPWLLMGELLPSRARGPCAAFATGSPRQVFFVRATFSLEWSPASTILDQRLTMYILPSGPIGLQRSW